MKNRLSKVLAGLSVLGVTALANAQTPDATTIISDASDAFNTVAALVAAAVSFFVIVKIVKWIRK